MRFIITLLLTLALSIGHALGVELDVRAFGVKCDNATDDVVALRKANAALITAGGGTLHFPPGTCVLSTTSNFTVRVPIAAANFQPQNESHAYHLLMQNVGGIRWLGHGTTLRSTATSGSEMFILDGVQDFSAEGIAIQSVTAKDGTGTVTTTGMNGFSITSQTRESYNIKLRNIKATNVYTAFYCFGDTASSFRVRGVSIENLRHEGGIYTLAMHNNCDNVVANAVHSSNTLRELFLFGASQVEVQMTSDTGVAGFGSIIKAYDRDTVGIRYKLKTTKVISAANVSIQSQHAPAVQATPKRVLGVTVDIDNTGTNITPVDFSYLRDTTLTGTSANNLFNGIRLRGVVDQPPTVSSTQAGAFGSYGSLNTDDLLVLNGSIHSLYNSTGFQDSKQTYNTFTPNIKINASAVGITYGGATVGEFWRDGQFIEGNAHIVLTNKGASVGAVTLDLPVTSSTHNFGNTVITGIGNANMAGMAGPITGYVQNAGSLLVLQIQGAAAVANMANTNLTNTSDFFIYFRYPL